MNKVILGLILAVCVLGMALVMLNERLGRENDSSPRMQAANEQMQPETPRPGASSSYTAPAQTDILPADNAAGESAPRLRSPSLEAAMRMEKELAEEALAPPVPGQPAADERGAEEAAQPSVAPDPEPVAVEPNAEAKPEPKPAAKPASAPKTQQPQAPKKDPEKPAAAKDGNVINRFVIYSREKGATVRIGGNGAIVYKSMTLENPDRVVLDLDGHWQFPPNPGVPKNDLVNNVRIGQMGDKTRVVIDLKEKPRSTRVISAKKGDSLDVRVDK